MRQEPGYTEGGRTGGENSGGFTLAELLIVVAIIGVLVAISIPIFSGQLEKSRIAADKANVRSAKAAASAEYMSDGETGSVTSRIQFPAGGMIRMEICFRTMERGFRIT